MSLEDRNTGDETKSSELPVRVDRESLELHRFPLHQNSDVRFVRFECCESIGVEEVQTKRVFFDPRGPNRNTSPGEDAPCPFCQNLWPKWASATDLVEYPMPWRLLRP